MENREILFRGIRVDTKQYVYGYYNRSLKPARYGSIDTYDRIVIDSVSNVFVIPETVGQFTGLLDKNGKKVFEGDKVQSTTIHNRQWIIEHRNDSEFIGFVPNEVGKVKNSLSTFVAWNTLEVIGTIHDHLLKGE